MIACIAPEGLKLASPRDWKVGSAAWATREEGRSTPTPGSPGPPGLRSRGRTRAADAEEEEEEDAPALSCRDGPTLSRRQERGGRGVRILARIKAHLAEGETRAENILPCSGGDGAHLEQLREKSHRTTKHPSGLQQQVGTVLS